MEKVTFISICIVFTIRIHDLIVVQVPHISIECLHKSLYVRKTKTRPTYLVLSNKINVHHLNRIIIFVICFIVKCRTVHIHTSKFTNVHRTSANELF